VTAAGGAPRDTGGRRYRVSRKAIGRATCSHCGTEYALRVDGTLRLHGRGPEPCCPGSFKSPAPHIHHCDCGARWDEDA
jgi:hypothetical protein